MKNILTAVIIALLVSSTAVAAPSIDTSAIDAGTGRSGQLMDGGVYRVSFPRSDLDVRVGGVKVQPGLGLGGYAAFVTEPQTTLVVGDLVLLEGEIQPVMSSLKSHGFEITALHNHLQGETPHVMFMHFMATGQPGTLATNLHSSLALSKTPLGPLPKSQPQSLAFQSAIEQGLDRKGKVSGPILSVSVPRAETITMNGMTVPPAAGVATAMNFEDAGNNMVATTGDFVLIANEVEPVQQALLSHGIEVTALHHHMLGDDPHLYYMHFWSVQSPDKIAAGLKAALAPVHVNREP
jgi:Domain of Unknown Function (DUF1259)